MATATPPARATADDRPHLVACTAEDDRRKEQDGGHHVELLVVDEADLARVERTRETTDAGTDGEGPHLVLEHGHAHDLRCILILTDGNPGAPDTTAHEVTGEQQHDDDHRERQPVPRRSV